MLPNLIGPPDGGAGQIANPWPLINALIWAGIIALGILSGLSLFLRVKK